jgi:translation initiation factor 5B
LYAVAKGEGTKKYEKLISDEIEKIRIATDIDGVVLKTDALGSLEAMAAILKKSDVPIRLADVGDVSKRDVIEAAVVKDHEPLYGAVLAFGVKVLPDAEEEASNRGVKIFLENIIYHVIDNYLSWSRGLREAELLRSFETLVLPGKIRVLQGFIFRRAKPAIFGVEILAGKLKPKTSVIRIDDGEEVGEVQQIQDKGKPLSEAVKGMQVAVSMDEPIVGRHVFEKDLLYVKVPESDAKALLTTFFDRLTIEEQEVLNEYVTMMRKKTPFWAA